MGFGNDIPSERTIYRVLADLGKYKDIIIEKIHSFLKDKKLLSKIQFADWSSVFFQGQKAQMAEYGYSREHRPDKKQITFGVWVGDNNIPNTLTIQNGNVVDKVHLNRTFKVIKKVFDKGTLLIFDCGANTKENKRKIKKLGYNYLTLKPKKKTIYKKYISYFKEQIKKTMKKW